MTKREEKNRSEGRRKLLKKAGVSSGAVAASSLLPDSWVKPAIKSVALPAHAETTLGGGGGGGGGTTLAATTTVAGTTVAGTTVAGTTVAGTTVAGTTVAGTTVAGTTVAGTTPVATTTLPPCMIDSAVLTDTGMVMYTAPGAATGITQAMPGAEFTMVTATTVDCPDGSVVQFVLDIDVEAATMMPSTETLTATVTTNMATFTPLTDAGMNAMGTGTFTILSSSAPIGGAPIVITLDWTQPA